MSLRTKYFCAQLVLDHSWFYFPASKLERSGEEPVDTQDYAGFQQAEALVSWTRFLALLLTDVLGNLSSLHVALLLL